MPVVSTPTKNQPSNRSSLERTALAQRSVSSCTLPASPPRPGRA